MKKIHLFLLLCICTLGANAQKVNISLHYKFDPETIDVLPGGADVPFALKAAFGAGTPHDYIPDDSRVVFKQPELVGSANSLAEAYPLQRSRADVNPSEIYFEANLPYILVTDSGTQVDKLLYADGSERPLYAFNVIRFKPNYTGQTLYGRVNFVFIGNAKELCYSIEYTQEPLPPIEAGQIAALVKSADTEQTVDIPITEPFRYGNYPVELKWERSEAGDWIAVEPLAVTATSVKLPLPEGKLHLVRCKFDNGAECAYSNVCKVLRLASISNQNYVRKFTFSDTAVTEDVTYYDGLGYPSHVVNVGASPTGRSIVTPCWYDAVRRDDARTYLPYVAANGAPEITGDVIAQQAAFYRAKYGSGEGYFYAEKVYEASALDRVVAEYKPGKVFRENGKKIVFGYRFNTENEALLLTYDGNTGNVKVDGTYPASTLKCSETTNEDGGRLLTYTDLRDRKMMERNYSDDNSPVDTYYVYDDWDQLCWVIQPEGAALLSAGDSLTPGCAIARKYCFRYRYDGRHRQTERQLPGREPEFLVYDRNDRPVMSQDGNMRAKGQWLLDKLDNFGRLTLRCIISYAEDYTWFQQMYDNGEQDQLLDHALRVENLLTNQYDVYPRRPIFSPGAENPESLVGPAPGTGLRPPKYRYEIDSVPGVVTQDEMYWGRTNGLLTFSTSTILAAERADTLPKELSTCYYYDSKGRPLQTVSDNHTGGLSRISYRYDQPGNLLARHEIHQYGREGRADTLLVEYTYDDRGRMLSETATLNGFPTSGRVDNTYDDLGRLSGRKYDARKPIKETYTYNLQGWQTRRSNPYFSMDLKYYAPSKPGSTPAFSGNISEWSWEHKNEDEFMAGLTQTYAFVYDKMQRLTGCEHFNGIAPDGLYVEKEIAYDRNGNIVSLGRSSSDATAVKTDYTYYGNQLQSPVPVPSQLYIYDENGNCTKDGGNRLHIDYNCLNLMQMITDNGGAAKVSYAYNADGTKVCARTASDYGFDYLGSLIYQTDASGTRLESAGFSGGELLRLEYPRRFAPPEIVYTPQYHLRDHLGSTRVVVNRDNVIQTRNDYYPFGGRWNSDGEASTNRWQFNGKESQQDFGLHFLDYGARIYDSRDGRWLTQDPLSEDYYSQSPYSFTGNNPVAFVDNNGMSYHYNDETGEYEDENGNFVFWSTVYDWMMSGYHSVKSSVNFSYGLSNDLFTPYLDAMINSQNGVISVAGLMGEFMTGFGSGKHDFYDDAPLTQSLKNANMTKIALRQFYADYLNGKNKSPYFMSFKPFGLGDTGPVREYNADGMTAVQFLGSSTYYFSIDGGKVNVHVYDTKTPNSLFYHAIPDRHSRETFPVMGETIQNYYFSVPLGEIPILINQ